MKRLDISATISKIVGGETPVILGNVDAGLQGKLCTCPELCRWLDGLALTKHVVCKGNCVEAVLPWQLRRWTLAQAGNRTCKFSRHAQWKEHWPEQHGEALHSGNCRTVLFPVTMNPTEGLNTSNVLHLHHQTRTSLHVCTRDRPP